MKINTKKRKQARFTVSDDEINDFENVSFEERRKKRKARLKRRAIIIRIILITILIIGLLIGSLIILDKKGVFNIEKIDVKGNKYYDDATIIKTSEIKNGIRLMSVEKAKIEDKINKLPYVKSVDISKKLPHTLVISVVERAPEYAVYSGGYYICIDKDLTILKKSNEAKNVKIIEGFSPKTVEEGEKFVTKDKGIFNQAIKLADIVQENNIKFYKISHRESIMRIFLSKNMVCEGTYDNLVNNVTKFNKIYDALNKKGIERATIYIGDNDYISFSPRID